MGSNLSIADTLARMEAKIAHHKTRHEHHAEQEAYHAGQQMLHAEQKGVHEAEHRKAIEHYETFKAASASVGEMLVDLEEPEPPPPPAPPPPEVVDTSGARWLSRLMLRVIDRKSPDEVFGASALIQEIQQRWGPKLRYRIQPRSVSATLRRWGSTGQIRLVRDGRSYHESLYTKP